MKKFILSTLVALSFCALSAQAEPCRVHVVAAADRCPKELILPETNPDLFDILTEKGYEAVSLKEPADYVLAPYVKGNFWNRSIGFSFDSLLTREHIDESVKIVGFTDKIEMINGVIINKLPDCGRLSF